jgi:hypothetical protein
MKKGKLANSFVDRWDRFSAKVPAFNLEGAEQTGSFVGLIASLGLYFVMAYYIANSASKIKDNASLTRTLVESARSGTD